MADGFTYTGEWRGGEIDGKGVATYANGDVYEGMFKAGKRQGEGVIRYASGQTAEGKWENGALSLEIAVPATPGEVTPPAEGGTSN
jgi:hypothetical protein